MKPAPVLAALAVLAFLPARAASGPGVVTDIPPVHSLVARVLGGEGAVTMLVPAGQSPHDHALRPSEARALGAADLVVIVGGGLTPWLDRPLATLAPRAYLVVLADIPGLPVPQREQDAAPGTGAPDSDHEEGSDPHLWLNPQIAAIWLPVIADALADLDPPNAQVYRDRAEAAVREVLDLDAALAARLRPLSAKGYIVAHDAFRHFEHRYHLDNLGAATTVHDLPPGAARLSTLRKLVESGDALCVFAEPGETAIAEQLAAGTGARLGVLDPLGAGIEPGPDLYPRLVANLADSLEACLGR
jgi:zinc transport system substrate-binding protein